MFAPNVKRTGVPDEGSLSRGGARAQPLVGHMVPYHPEALGVDGKLPRSPLAPASLGKSSSLSYLLGLSKKYALDPKL